MSEKESAVELAEYEKDEGVPNYSNEENRRRDSIGVGSVVDGPLSSRRQSGISSRTGYSSRRTSGIPEGPVHDEEAVRNLYRPEDKSFTVRAVLLGSVAGALIAISNMYLGLKSGITIGATLFATLLGTVLLGPVVRMSGNQLGIREHTCFQAAGTAAGGMNGGLVAPVLVLFWNGFFQGSVSSNIGSLCLLVFGAGFFGLVFAATLRKFAVVKQNLVFPDGTAAAEVLLTMYISKQGADEGRKKTKVMIICFGIAFVAAILFFFFPVFMEFPIFRYLSNCGTLQSYAECKEIPGVYLYWLVMDYWAFKLLVDPVFVASAFMVGPPVNVWFFIGGIIALPVLTTYDFVSGHIGETPSFSRARDKVLMWPAVISMLASSIVAILLSYEIFLDSFKSKDAEVEDEEGNIVPFELDERDKDTPWYIWLPLLAISVAFAAFVYMWYFGDTVVWWHCLIGIISAFPIAIVIVQVLGRTNWNIAAVLAKLAMIILGLCGASANSMLLIGNMVSQSSAQTGEVCQCYKTGHLVNAAPRAQFNAQIIGTTIGGFCSIFAFWLYTTAYPCMVDLSKDGCPFAMSAGHAWRVLADALAEGITVGDTGAETVTTFGFYLLIAMPIITVAEQILSKFVIPERFLGLMPVWTVFYLAWLIPPEYGIAQMLGQIIHWGWKWAKPEQCAMYTYSVAAGLIAGGSIATIVTAVFNVFNVPSLGWGLGF